MTLEQLDYRAWDGSKMHYNIVPYPYPSVNAAIFRSAGMSTSKVENKEAFNLGAVTELTATVRKVTEFMMWSGLYDKNKKKIYDGDIVELVNAAQVTIRVICRYGSIQRYMISEPYQIGKENTLNLCEMTCFYFVDANGRNTLPIVNNYAGCKDTDLFEVVGNVHENPDKVPQ